MTKENHKALISSCLFVLVAIMHMLSHGYAESRDVVAQKHKGTVKTIESDSDVIDCVDIYKQPAFDHPLIKDLQMEPTSYPSGMKMDDSQPELFQEWHKYGECPEGTVPIRRTTNHNLRRNFPSPLFGRQPNHSFAGPLIPHEYAVVSQRGAAHGAIATINVWNPKPEDREFSLSQIWVISDSVPNNLNTIEAGWIVFPQLYHDSATRFFIYWTSDGYRTQGCYDLGCPGFVQTNNKIAIGSPIAPVSAYNGEMSDILLTIFKDMSSGNWFLQLQGTTLGYWPRSIFTGLADSATRVDWGGEIVNRRLENHHTTTQMGSGHFSLEHYGKSSYFHNLEVIDNNDIRRSPGVLNQLVTNPSCYDLQIQENTGTAFGTHFYYGGPGFSAQCP